MDVREKAANDKRLIDADAFLEKMKRTSRYFDVVFDIEEMPTVDAVPVVRCEKCVLHGNCITEDTFVLAGIENPFCCVGKRKEGAD